MADDRLLVQLTVGDLKRVVAEAAREIVREELAGQVLPRYLSTDQVAELLGVSDKTVVTLIVEQGLPESRRLGQQRRFELAAVTEWMRKRPAPVTPLRRVR